MHSSTQIPDLYLYISNGYFNAFFTHIHKLLGDKVHYAFSSTYSIGLVINDTVPQRTHVITYEEGDLD